VAEKGETGEEKETNRRGERRKKYEETLILYDHSPPKKKFLGYDVRVDILRQCVLP